MTKFRPTDYGVKSIRALQKLAEGMSIEATAREVEVQRKTLRKWMMDESFEQLLQELRSSYPSKKQMEAIDTLTSEAVETLQRALQGDDEVEAARTAREVLKLTKESVSQKKEARWNKGGLGDKKEVTVRHMTPDGKPVSSSPWADRNPVKRRK